MQFIKALGVSTHNWKVMVKAIFCQLIIIALVVTVASLLFSNLFFQIVNLLDSLQIGEFLSSVVNSISEGTFDSNVFAAQLQQIIEDVSTAIEQLPNFLNRVEFSYILAIVIMCIYRMLLAATDVTVAYQLNEFMSSNARRPFTWYFFKKFGQSFRFTLLQFVICAPLDGLILFGMAGFYVMFVVAFKWWAIFPAMLLGIALYTLRHVLMAFWLPTIATSGNNSVTQCLRDGIAKLMYHFWQVYWKNLVVLLFVVLLSAVVTFHTRYLPAGIDATTVGAIATSIISLVGFFVIKCINMAEFYKANNRPFFYKRFNVYGTEIVKNKKSK